uniref:Transmembrane protein n=1 Tax=Ascaris lumbricoides TaxID=6252 RepID=A0A0M3I9V1_ASCLU
MFQQSTHRSGTVVTLEDLWLSCTLLHVVCVLLVDLALPARRIRYAVVVDNAWESKSSGHDRSVLDMSPMRVEQTLTRSGSVQSTLERRVVDEEQQQELHLQMATMWIGARKRIALSSIIICYQLALQEADQLTDWPDLPETGAHASFFLNQASSISWLARLKFDNMAQKTPFTVAISSYIKLSWTGHDGEKLCGFCVLRIPFTEHLDRETMELTCLTYVS